MDYIFSKKERDLYKIAMIASCVLVMVIFSVIMTAIQGVYSLITGAVGLLCFLPVIIGGFSYSKYQFAKYEFARGEVCNFIKDKNVPFQEVRKPL